MRLNAKQLVLQIPIGEEEDFEGVIDLINMKAYYFRDPTSETFDTEDIPQSLLDKAVLMRGLDHL